MAYSTENYDLKISKQRAISFVDVFIPYAPALTKYTLGDIYGSVVVGGFIYVALTSIPGKIRKINSTNGAVVTDITVGNDPRGLCYDGTYIWCANYDLGHVGPANTVSKIDPTNDIVIATLTVGLKPVMIEYDGHGSVWVACTGSKLVYCINTTTNAISTVALTFMPGSLAYDNRAYMNFIGNTRVNIFTKKVTKIATVRGFYGVCSAGEYIWGTDFGKGVYRVNSKNSVATKFISPRSPTRRPGFDGKRVWIPCGSSNHTVVLDQEGNLVADLNIGSGSNKFVCFDDTNAYISAGNDLVKVPLF